MFSLFSSIIKISLFTVVILLLGNSIHIGGRTVSDQIRIGLSQVERGPIGDKVKAWSAVLTSDMKKGAAKISTAPGSHVQHQEKLEPSERLKLKKLIEDLNH